MPTETSTSHNETSWIKYIFLSSHYFLNIYDVKFEQNKLQIVNQIIGKQFLKGVIYNKLVGIFAGLIN